MSLFTDQTGYTIEINSPPRRIISLVPSQTELLFDLGLDTEVVGITKFCVHPASWFTGKPKVGGTKTVKPEVVSQLQPDLIIANKEENDRETVETLRAVYPVWTSDIQNLDDALQMIKSIGEITGTTEKAGLVISSIEAAFGALPGQVRANGPATAYLIWRDPFMAAGGDTFIHAMMNSCGLTNIFEDKRRYPVIEIEDIRKAGCALLLLSSEPYPFKEKHLHELQLELPETRIRLVDGEMFSWYGSRLTRAPAYFQQLLQSVEE